MHCRPGDRLAVGRHRREVKATSLVPQAAALAGESVWLNLVEVVGPPQTNNRNMGFHACWQY